MRNTLTSWFHAEPSPSDTALEGQSMVEYALIIMLTTLVCIAAVTLVGANAKTFLWDVIDLGHQRSPCGIATHPGSHTEVPAS
jgi:hypothetical protein